MRIPLLPNELMTGIVDFADGPTRWKIHRSGSRALMSLVPANIQYRPTLVSEWFDDVISNDASHWHVYHQHKYGTYFIGRDRAAPERSDGLAMMDCMREVYRCPSLRSVYLTIKYPTMKNENQDSLIKAANYPRATDTLGTNGGPTPENERIRLEGRYVLGLSLNNLPRSRPCLEAKAREAQKWHNDLLGHILLTRENYTLFR